MERWQGKVAIVTGASGGIGAAIAEKLAQEGIKVVGLARRIELIESLAKKYPNKQINAFKADLTKTEDIKAAFKWTLENLGPVHILVNNAGIMPKTPVLGGDIETWRKTFETNVLATAIASDLAYKIMMDHGIDGHIVNINSIIGHEHLYMPNLGLYGPSKFAVTSYTEQLRKEFTHFNSKIKTTSVSPGFVESGLLVDYTAEEQKMFDSLPSLKAADVADALAYVLSTPPNVQITELTIRPVGDKF